MDISYIAWIKVTTLYKLPYIFNDYMISLLGKTFCLEKEVRTFTKHLGIEEAQEIYIQSWYVWMYKEKKIKSDE